MPTTSIVVLLKIPLLFSLLSSSLHPLPFPPVPVIFHNFLTLLNIACLGLLPAATPTHCAALQCPAPRQGCGRHWVTSLHLAPQLWWDLTDIVFSETLPWSPKGPGYMSSATCARGGQTPLWPTLPQRPAEVGGPWQGTGWVAVGGG